MINALEIKALDAGVASIVAGFATATVPGEGEVDNGTIPIDMRRPVPVEEKASFLISTSMIPSRLSVATLANQSAVAGANRARVVPSSVNLDRDAVDRSLTDDGFGDELRLLSANQ